MEETIAEVLTSSAAESSGQITQVRGMHHRTWHRKHLRVATHRLCEHVTTICTRTNGRMDGLSRADIAGWNKTASKRARTRHVCLARTRRRNDSSVSFMFFFPVRVTAFLRVMTLKNVHISRARFSHERRIRYVRISTARTTCHTDSIAWNMRRADVTRRLTHASTTTAANERANHHRARFLYMRRSRADTRDTIRAKWD